MITGQKADLLSCAIKEMGTEVWKRGIMSQRGRGLQMTVNHHGKHSLPPASHLLIKFSFMYYLKAVE